MAEAQVAASVAQGSFVGAQQVADYLRVQRAARERRHRRFGLTPHESMIYELDRDRCCAGAATAAGRGCWGGAGRRAA